MKILIVSQYFWPENFRINELAVELKRRGFKVVILTGEPNYPSGKIFPEYIKNPDNYLEYEGMQVIRCPIYPRGGSQLKLVLNYLSFMISGSVFGLWALRRQDFDEIFVFQTSPVTAVIPAILIKKLKRAKLSIWVLDLWPEALLAMNILKKGYVFSSIESLIRWIYKNCDRLYISSLGFVESIKKYAPKEIGVMYFPQWVEDVYLNKPDLRYDCSNIISSTSFNIIYGGNIGESQDFESVLKAADLLRDENVIFFLIGDGRAKKWLDEKIVSLGLVNTVKLLGPYPSDLMGSIYARASALLVSLCQGPIFSTALPGKIQTYLYTGRPIVGMLDGEGARVLRESGAADVVPAGDFYGLAKSIIRLKNMTAYERESMGLLGASYATKHFLKSSLISSLILNMGHSKNS